MIVMERVHEANRGRALHSMSVHTGPTLVCSYNPITTVDHLPKSTGVNLISNGDPMNFSRKNIPTGYTLKGKMVKSFQELWNDAIRGIDVGFDGGRQI